MLFRITLYTTVVLALLLIYLDKQNELTKLKIMVPKAERELVLLKEENRRIKYEIEQFESPSHLMELARLPEFAHLRHPLVKDVLKVEEGIALQLQH